MKDKKSVKTSEEQPFDFFEQNKDSTWRFYKATRRRTFILYY